jgi:endonuclease/exonuclease/phosphatase family metal-dependent hydrolase
MLYRPLPGRPVLRVAVAAMAVICLAVICLAAGRTAAEDSLRIATYNASLYGAAAGQIRQRMIDGADTQAEQVAAIVQTVRPDVLLINEVDYDDGAATALLLKSFFASGQGGRQPIDYRYVYAVPSNTGIDSGRDLDGDGAAGGPGDAWGYGAYPGQYAMAIYSRYPIRTESVRSFQNFRWSKLPGALRPTHPASGQPYHRQSTWDALRLSSKNHVDVPIDVAGVTLHVLASHPTPPVFDGSEDRNGCRNHDEIRFWIDYLNGPESTYLIDDQGRSGGLARDAFFVIVGDLNSDPHRGDSRQEAIRRLLRHPRLIDPQPRGAAGNETNTASFGTDRKLRVDYVLPSRTLRVKQAGVFWPAAEDANRELISASDHRMVWVEVEMP